MKTRHLFVFAGSAAIAAIALVALTSSEPADAGPGHLEVHEWGTFTSMQGPDGLWLEGLHHEEEALPGFVHSMGNTEGRRRPTKGGLWVERVTRKMETPVIYFYAAHPMRVQVDVRFPSGLINEWYPAAHQRYRSWSRQQAAIERAERPHDVRSVSSSIRWDVDVIPRERGELEVPAVKAGDPWQLAREVRAAMVRNRSADRESEAYLFYRGLGRESIALHAREDGKGRLLVDNKTTHRVNAVFALEVSPAGARYVAVGAVAAKRSKAAALATRTLRPTGRVIAELRARVKKALVAEGLYRDEAEAMVATWSRQWFASEGTRLIYVVPRAEIDRMLPIQIAPKPRRLVRAFIGRVEVITSAMRREVARALANGDEARLARLGRFEEPYLRLLASQPSRSLQGLAQKRLERIRSAR